MFLSKTFPDLNILKDLGLYGIGIEHNSLTPENVGLAHERKLKVFAWTVDKEEDVRAMLNLGVDFIASNDPALAIKITNE